MSWYGTIGRNNVKAGAEFRAMQFNYHTDMGTFMGGYPIIFDPTNTAPAWYDINAYDQVGNAFGSFLLGDVYNAETNNPDNEYGRRKAFSWYGSDDAHGELKLDAQPEPALGFQPSLPGEVRPLVKLRAQRR